MHRIDDPAADVTDPSKPIFTEGNPSTGLPATAVRAAWLNAIQEEIAKVIEAAGEELDAEDNTQLYAAILSLVAQPGYDVPFLAGFDGFGVAVDLATQLYGSIVAARDFTISGAYGYIGTNPTGAAVEVDVKKNGVTIYSARPSFAATTGVFSAGTLDGTVTVSAGDRLDFSVAQVGSTIAGQALRFTLKGQAT